MANASRMDIATLVLISLACTGEIPTYGEGQGRQESSSAETVELTFASPPPSTDARPLGARAFDFLHGRWTIHNRVLRERLASSDDWREWSATVSVVPVLGGYGNVDRYVSNRPEGRLEGVTVRLYDPTLDAWTIHWMDDRSYRLIPQVTGEMGPDGGVFHGEEEFQGRTVAVRFVWEVSGSDRARWEQAYQRADGSWETNWVMDLERAAGSTP